MRPASSDEILYVAELLASWGFPTPRPHLSRAVQLLGNAPEVILRGQGVQLVLHIIHKLLQRHQLVWSVELPPGGQSGDDLLTQVSHGRAPLDTQVGQVSHCTTMKL